MGRARKARVAEWSSAPNGARRRPGWPVYMSRPWWAVLDHVAAVTGLSRGAVVERLLRDALGSLVAWRPEGYREDGMPAPGESGKPDKT